MKYDVCIISQDRLYSQWILLLLSERTCSVTVSDNALTAPASSLYIVDLDSAQEPKKELCDVLCFSQDEQLLSKHGGILRPFSPDELFCAIDGLSAHENEEKIDKDTDKVISFGGRRIRLTAREFALFSLLQNANGRSVSRQTLCQQIWGCDETESLNIYIYYLRKKLERNGVKAIRSHRGKGYSLIVRGDESALHN